MGNVFMCNVFCQETLFLKWADTLGHNRRVKNWFGTDGIRGVAGERLSAELALALGKALGRLAQEEKLPPSLVVGQDSRVSGDMLAHALAAGASAMGLEVTLLGLCPTPAVSLAARGGGHGFGVMVSASHNPVQDNGLKVFGGDGFKLTDAREARVGALLNEALAGTLAGAGVGVAMGDIRPAAHGVEDYIAAIKKRLPEGLAPMRLGLDCAHGAACHAAHAVFDDTPHELVWLSDTPDGHRINVKCGSTDLNQLKTSVKSLGLGLGFAFDGDADRLLVVDDRGETVDGDLLMFLLATWLKSRGLLKENLLVTTQMSNIGLDAALAAEGIAVDRTEVGDRYVLERMRERGGVLGGEQSGHLIYLDAGFTGDGILSAVLILAALADGFSIQKAAAKMTLKKQRLTNRRLSAPIQLKDFPAITTFQQEQNARLGTGARYYVRPSGTEPLMRLLVEADTESQLDDLTAQGWGVLEEILGERLMGEK